MDAIKRFRDIFGDCIELDGVNKQIELESFIEEEIRKAKEKTKNDLSTYLQHDILCIRSRLSEGRPTAVGGYEQKFNGKWYEARPVDKTPKCDCGLDDVLK